MKVKLIFIYFFLLLNICFYKNSVANQEIINKKKSASCGNRIGFGLATEFMNADAILRIDSPESLGNFSSTGKHFVKKFQFAPFIELGAIISHAHYIGLQVSWRNSGAKDSLRSPMKNSHHFIHAFKLKSSLNVFFKPGIIISPNVIIYGLIGPSILDWSHTTERITVDAVTQVATINDQFSINKKRQVGLGLGAGFEYIFQQKYALSFDYTYHKHHSAKTSHQITHTDNGNIRSGTLVKTVEPSYSTVALRFTVFFSSFK